MRLDAVERDYTSRIAGLEADAAKGAEVARNLENALSAATAKIRGRPPLKDLTIRIGNDRECSGYCCV